LKIFIHETLVIAKHSCKSIIEKISKDLSRSQSLQQKDISGEFLSAVERISDMYDSDIIKLVVDNKDKIDSVLKERGL